MIERLIAHLSSEIAKHEGTGSKMDMKGQAGFSDLHTAAYVGALKVLRAALQTGHTIEKAIALAMDRYRALNPRQTADAKWTEERLRKVMEPKTPEPEETKPAEGEWREPQRL